MPSPSLSLGGYEYWELHEGSGIVEFSDKPTATRVLKTAWANRSNLARKLRGYTTIVDGALVIFGATPHPSFADLYPTSIKCSPMGCSSGEDTYEWAKLTVEYEALEYDPSSPEPEDLYSEKLTTSYEILTIPGETHTSPGGTYDSEPTQITIPKVAYDLTIHRVPTLPFPKIMTFMGTDSKPKVNSSTFRGAAAGHMLFLGADASRKTTTFGIEDWEVTYHFLYSHIDHRKKYDPKSDTFKLWEHKVTGDPLYEEGDFNSLFY